MCFHGFTRANAPLSLKHTVSQQTAWLTFAPNSLHTSLPLLTLMER